MKVVSFFSGAGGLDLGFKKAGFNIVWANEFDKRIWETYEKNNPDTKLDKRSIIAIKDKSIPDCDGIIGGPPCQSWSEAGALRGLNDKRGQLFFDFMRLLKAKQPMFFLAENVSGMLLQRHRDALHSIKHTFQNAGYRLSFKLLNAADYGVPQDRKRLFFVGIRNDLRFIFEFPTIKISKTTLEDAISDLRNEKSVAFRQDCVQDKNSIIQNNEHMIGGFSSIFMSRNRVRSWQEQSFTIQASGRHIPFHPQAPKMQLIKQDKRVLKPGSEHLYRRLTVRECARIQTFPDNFIFYYNKIATGYKMVGNAVPIVLATILAKSIKFQIEVRPHG